MRTLIAAFFILFSFTSFCADTGEKKPMLPGLFEAIEKNDYAGVKNALESGADANATNENGEPALYLASRNKKSEIVKLLLERGGKADTVFELPDFSGIAFKKTETSIFARAVINKQWTIVDLLEDKGGKLQKCDSKEARKRYKKRPTKIIK